MITPQYFLSLFHKNSNPNNFTINTFIKNAKVLVGDHTVPLNEYMKNRHLSLKDIQLLVDHIKTRDDYLMRFYEKSLSVPADLQIIDTPMKNGQMNNNHKVNYKNVIRNMFFFEIMRNTKSCFSHNRNYFEALNNLYNHWIIDNKLLAPSSLYYIKEGRIGSVFSSYFFRASILNPYLVFSLQNGLLKGTRIFTPTLGWGSYYYGFAESGILEYVGTDVIPSVCKKVKSFSEKYYSHVETNILCSPSEDLESDPSFMKKYKNHFDVVFFSPPYFKLELYEGKQQSTHKYPTYELWLKEYWEKTIQLCHKVLMTQGKLCYIISSYGKDNEYDLVKDMNQITKKYFKLKNIQPMFNKNVHVTKDKHRETDEQIMIFVKE